MPMTREYPDHPRVAVGVVVLSADRSNVLLIKRGKPPEQGRWSLPGGGQELGETLADCAMREVLEETGVNIRIAGIITAVDSIKYDARNRVKFHYSIIDFAAVWIDGTPVAGDDVTEAVWAPVADLAPYRLWDKTLEVIQRAGLHLS